MADTKFSGFTSQAAVTDTSQLVGLKAGVNSRWLATVLRDYFVTVPNMQSAINGGGPLVVGTQPMLRANDVSVVVLLNSVGFGGGGDALISLDATDNLVIIGFKPSNHIAQSSISFGDSGADAGKLILTGLSAQTLDLLTAVILSSANIIAALEGAGYVVPQSAIVTLTADDIAALNSVPFQLLTGIAASVAFPGQMVWEFTPDSGGGSFSGSARNFGVYLDPSHPLDVIAAGSIRTGTTIPASIVLETTHQVGLVTVVSANQGTNIWWGADASFVNVPLMLKASAAFTYSGLVMATSISGAGSGYYAGQLVNDGGDVAFTINTVGASGEVLTYIMTSPGTDTYGVGNSIALQSVTPIPITALVQLAQTFTVAGDQSAKFIATGVFGVSGSTGNDGTYTTVSAIFGAGVTVITTVEAIPDATPDGNIDPGGGSASLQVDSVANDATLKITTSFQPTPI